MKISSYSLAAARLMRKNYFLVWDFIFAITHSFLRGPGQVSWCTTFTSSKCSSNILAKMDLPERVQPDKATKIVINPLQLETGVHGDRGPETNASFCFQFGVEKFKLWSSQFTMKDLFGTRNQWHLSTMYWMAFCCMLSAENMQHVPLWNISNNPTSNFAHEKNWFLRCWMVDTNQIQPWSKNVTGKDKAKDHMSQHIFGIIIWQCGWSLICCNGFQLAFDLSFMNQVPRA